MKQWLFLLFLLFVPFVVADPCQENQERQCGTTDIGACTYGIQICQGGQWSVCFGNIDPGVESCDNGQDEDCDGQVDEDCFCVAETVRDCTGNTQGICRPGSQTCINGTQWGTCFNQTFPLANDLCNNSLDDDCDGQVDEGCQVQQQNQTPQTGTCFNNVQDGDETGIDCGGSCHVCTFCNNSILNQGEYKTAVDLGNGTLSDCGGPNCPSCPTCSDKIKNQNETGIDCGGPCQTCQQTSPDPDEDQDGLNLSVELQKGTDPLLKDTDKDGINDKQDRTPLCPNTICDSAYGEDEDSCPEDCVAEGSSLGIVLLIFFILLLTVGGYLYYQFKKSGKLLSTSMTKKEASQPVYIDKNLLQQSSNKEQQSKVDTEIEQSLKKAEKYFK